MRRCIPRRRKRAIYAVAFRLGRTPHGFILHLTAREANTMIINQVFDEIERWLSPG